MCVVKTTYREKLEICRWAYKDYYGSCTEDRIVTLSGLYSTLKKCTEIFARRCAELKENFIIDIDRDVDYRHWSDLWAMYAEQTTVDDDIREVLQRFSNTLLDIANTISSPHDDAYFVRLFHNMKQTHYAHCSAQAADDYQAWHDRLITHNIHHESLTGYVNDAIVRLLDAGVLDGFEPNATRAQQAQYKKDIDLDNFSTKQKSRLQKGFCCLREVYEPLAGTYAANEANAGRLVFKLRKEPEKLQHLFTFEHTLDLVGTAIDKLQAATHIGSVLDDIDFSKLTCRFNDEEVRASGIALVHARPVLAIMDRMKEDAPKIYWFGFYCVLLEKGWIKENITDFCYRMNALFGIGLDRSALNKEKTDIKTDIREWPETGSCATEKKNFALRFMAYVDFYLDYKRRQLMA